MHTDWAWLGSKGLQGAGELSVQVGPLEERRACLLGVLEGRCRTGIPQDPL